MDRNFINAAQTHSYVPRLTKEQVEAIDSPPRERPMA